MWHYHTNNKKQLVQKCITTHRYTHTHTHTQTHAGPCVVMLMVITAMRTDEQDLGRHAPKERICCPPSSHLPVFSHLASSLLSLPPSFFPSPCWADISVPRDPLTSSSSSSSSSSPSLFSSSGHQTWAPAHNATHFPPAKTQTKPPSFICPQTKSPPPLFSFAFFFFFFPALSVLSSFSLTISCGGLRTHQLSWV